MISWKWFARRFILVFVVYLLVAVNLGVCYAASLSTKSKYAPSETIIVNYFGFPGTASDWITIVPAGTPDNQYKEWHYTNGQPNRTMSFSGLEPGAYEVRGYFNWSGTQSYTVQARHRFIVN